MATNQAGEALVQIATRVPVSLHYAVTFWCAKHDVPVMRFVEDAVREKLRRVRSDKDPPTE